MAQLGVIDIGSNAVRVLIGEVDREGCIEQSYKERVPISLGQDVFAHGEITENSVERLSKAFLKFRAKFGNHGVAKVRAVATSAVREAQNQAWFVEEIEKRTGIGIEVIDGEKEAELIFQAVRQSFEMTDAPTLLMDIGGGSVEFIRVENQKFKTLKSFPVGTVRTLKQMPDNIDQKGVEAALKLSFADIRKFLKKNQDIKAFVGTGGNVECLGYLRKTIFEKTRSSRVKRRELPLLLEYLFMMDFEERQEILKLRPDRAKVILPACVFVSMVMNELPVDRLHIPRVGLREGAMIDLAKNL